MDKNGFILPELILESVIRDGIANIKDDPTILDSVFEQLTRPYASGKYGQAEIDKIKALILEKEIAVVYSYHEVDAKNQCFSIMIGTDTEDKRRAHLGDNYGEKEEEITDPDELEALIRVPDMVVTSYDPISGKVTCANGTDLSIVTRFMIFVDASDVEYQIRSGISDVTGDKFFFIDKELEDVDISNFCFIKSPLDYKRTEIRGVTDDVQLVIGAHSKDALTTKYLYILLKYFILSRKIDLIKRGFYVASFSGSDFNRDSQYLADHVFTRFLTMTGKVDDTWRSDQVVLIDNIVVEAEPVE